MIKPYHLNIGDRLFVYAGLAHGSALLKSFGPETNLCKVVDLHFPVSTCVCCGNEKMTVEYKVEVVDSEDPEKIGRVEWISKQVSGVCASRFQDIGSYFGHWAISKPEKHTEPLQLIKRVQKPDRYGFLGTIRLLHLIYPNAHQSVIVPRFMITDQEAMVLAENYDKLISANYGSIPDGEDGETKKGWHFEFTDENLNFES